MGAANTTTWPLEPHTRAKHEILRRYLEAWAPILSLGGFKQILYVDAFAGPGRYAGGEDGSPVIALKAALGQKTSITATVLFYFVEERKNRAEMLEQVIAALQLPKNFRHKVDGGKTFEEGFGQLLESYKSKNRPLPPTFAFIDPFGWTGAPFSLVNEIMSYPNCEVLVNFMFEEINRFINLPDQERNFDRLFGTDEWRAISSISAPRARCDFLHGLYLRQLRTVANVRYVRSFEMRNEKDVTDYFLIFGTNSAKGIKKMKEAMWKVDRSGEFRFSDATNPAQGLLFEQVPDAAALRKALLGKFARTVASVAEIEDFVLADTPFRETHYKKILRELELSNPPALVAVDPPAGRRKGTYRDPKLRLRFVE